MGLDECIHAGQCFRDAQDHVLAARSEAIKVAATTLAAGVPEAAVARALSVTRTTLRKWMGK